MTETPKIKTADKYAIALEHTRIALLKRRDDQAWDVEDSVDIEGHDETKIAEIFAPFAKKWRSISKKVSICLPSDVVKYDTLSLPLSAAETTAKSHRAKNANYWILIGNQADIEDGFNYAQFDVEHVSLSRRFLEKFDFQIHAIGYSDFGLKSCAPIFFPIKQFPKITIAPKTSQFELDFAATVSNLEPQNAFSTLQPISDKNERGFLWPIVGALILVIVGGGLWWAFAPTGGSKKINQTELETAPISTPIEEIELEQPSTIIEESVAPATPDPEPTPSEITGVVAEEATQTNLDDENSKPALLLIQKPEFTIIPRPEAHDQYVDDFPNSSQVAVAKEIGMTQPPSRPTTLNIPEPSPVLRLIGISGSAGSPGALIQSATGDFKSVKTGDKIDGWTIVAISKKEVIISQLDQKETLTVPRD